MISAHFNGSPRRVIPYVSALKGTGMNRMRMNGIDVYYPDFAANTTLPSAVPPNGTAAGVGSLFVPAPEFFPAVTSSDARHITATFYCENKMKTREGKWGRKGKSGQDSFRDSWA